MKIALASARLVDCDVPFNLQQMEKFMREAKAQGAELVCFGESFLQGFECLKWDYEIDKDMAVRLDSPTILKLRRLTEEIGVDVLFGFIERDGETLYSSCALLSGGRVLHLYRRISVGWKEYSLADGHYREGASVKSFFYRGKKCLIALCGDLWVYPERFCQEADLLFWPVFVNFSIDEWNKTELAEYALQASRACKDVLFINSIVQSDVPAFGGCCHFAGGKTCANLPMGEEGLLVVEV